MTASMTVERGAFEAEASRTMQRLREAFGAILDALPDQPRRPSEIRPALNVPQHIARRIAGIINEPDPFLAAQHLIGERRLEAFFKAATKKGVPSQHISAARVAIAELDHLTEVHAGDRESLEMMLLACSQKQDEDVSYSHRRAAFQSNSFIWGVQARVQISTVFFFPSDKPERAHGASIRGLIDLRRIRPDQPWVIGRPRTVDDQLRDEEMGRTPRPIDPLDEESGAWMLPEFCSKPLPKVRRIPRENGYIEEELLASPVGNTGLTTCLCGHWVPYCMPTHRSPTERYIGGAVSVRAPVELLIRDMLVHRDLPALHDPQVKVYSDINRAADHTVEYEEPRDLLDVGAHVDRTDVDLIATKTPDVPRYTEMLRYVCERLETDLSDFEMYQVRIRYPVVPSTVAVMADLPE